MAHRAAGIRRLLTVSFVIAGCCLIVSGLLGGSASAADVTDPTVCVVERSGSSATLSWLDDGGTHVVRRNGTWLATPGSGVSTHVDDPAPPGATYVVRTWDGGSSSDRSCDAAPPPTTSTTTTTSTPPGPQADCSFTRDGTITTIEWIDDGGTHVVRRDGRWLATVGSGVDTYVDRSAPPTAGYELRTWSGGERTDRPCVDVTDAEPPPPPPPPAGRVAERVIHVSIDGLRADHVTVDLMPNLRRLITEGASTLNARTDPAFTQTLPNHTSQFTGRSTYGAAGHHVDYNVDRGTTVHQEAGEYVASVFDVVHDHGGSTILYAGKGKFEMMNRNWVLNGGPDVTGSDDGSAKIDDYRQIAPAAAVQPLADQLGADPQLEYAFFHIRDPDHAGHEFAWASAEYAAAATAADEILGQLLSVVENDPRWSTTTALIVVADHGGPTGELLHFDETIAESYTIPFVVWGPTVAAGADLYQLNPSNRRDPGSSQLPISGTQPIRGHEVANLALELLGYPPVPGSSFNHQQDLAVR